MGAPEELVPGGREVSGDKRWELDAGGELWWTDGPFDPTQWMLTVEDLKHDEVGFGNEAGPAYAALADALDDAARLRSLAATFGSHLNRGQTYTGAQVAAMLREVES